MKVWAEMVDPDQELKIRGLKPAFGPMAMVRNRRQLLKVVEKEDADVLEAFQVRTVIFLSHPVGSTELILELLISPIYEVQTSMHARRTGAKCGTAFLCSTVPREMEPCHTILRKCPRGYFVLQ